MVWLVDRISTQVGNTIQATIDEQFTALQSLASLYERFGPGASDWWRERDALFLEQRPGLVASFLRPGGRGTGWDVYTRSLEAAEIEDLRRHLDLVELANVVRQSSGPFVHGPFAGLARHGALYYAVGLPFGGPAGTSGGAFITVVDVGRMLASIVRERAAGFAVRVEWGDTVLFARDADQPKDEVIWNHAREVRLPKGPAWRVRMAPLAAGAASPVLRRMDTGTLWAGFIVSLLLAALAHEALLSRDHAQVTARVLQDLRVEMRNTERAQAQLRLLNSELEKRVEDRTRALNDAIEDLKVFNYSVSHDLRSPLGAIASFAAILQEDYGARLDEDGREYLRRIHGSAGNVLGMMDGLLTLSRLAHSAPNLQPTALDPLVRDVVREVQATLARPVRFDVERLPAVLCDQSMMRIVFTNLIRNAVKFTRETPEPRVHVGARSREDGLVDVFVADNGVGFEPKFAARLFRPFERLHAQSRFEGHGLGLAIVERILRFHGARARGESVPGQGATFTFALSPG